MSVSITSRSEGRRLSLSKLASAAAVALCVGLAAPAANAQHHGGGGGFHGGGGGGFHGGGGGFHGGGGYRGGYGGWHGGYGGWHGGWGWGGYGWGGWYPGFGIGVYDPFWYGDYYDYGPPPVAYAPPPNYYGPAGPADPADAPQSQGYAPVTPSSAGEPTDNARGFYTWQVGVENGSCNRPYLAQVATRLTGMTPVGLGAGATLGGIPVDRVIGGKIGPRLDVVDQACAMESLERAHTGTTVSWQTSAGIPVTFQPTRSYTLEDGRRCREYTATARFASHTESLNALACRNNATGAWELSR
jgi:hypothetical protein